MLIHGVIASSYKAGGSFESIATATGTGSSGTITFSSIPSTYKHLQIRGIARTTSGSAGNASSPIYITFNGDTGANYAYHRLLGDGTSAASYGTASDTSILEGAGIMQNGATASTYAVSLIDIHDYSSTTKNKTVRKFSGADANTASANFYLELGSGLWMSTSAITSITLTSTGTWNTSSTFALYGIKGA